MEQAPLYNAANFAIGPGTGGGMMGSLPNSTVYNSVISTYLCPSDPNADFDRSNSYHASIGPTTYESPIHTSGMFAVWTSFGIRDCTDGSSNTIAFAEALTGDDLAGFGYGTQQNTAAAGTPYRGNLVVNATDPGTGGQGADDPVPWYGKNAQFLNAAANSTAVLQALQICATAWKAPTAIYSSMRGFSWADGNGGWTYTNIIQTPNRDSSLPRWRLQVRHAALGH